MSAGIAVTIVNKLSSNLNCQKGKFVASEFVSEIWEMYSANHKSDNNINGKVFEEIVAMALVKSDLMPFYMQANVAFIPNVNYDFILYDDTSLVSLSAKVSLRERWKQADLEAVALRYIHRKSKSFVITMNEREAAARNAKISECMGINSFVVATSKTFDKLIAELKLTKFKLSPTFEVVASKTIIDSNTAASRYKSGK
jgi:hypothetical protein